jgi:cytochrome c556
MRRSIGILMLLLSATVLAAGEPALTLSPKLRAALLAEMAGLKAGVAELSVSLANGEWDKTAERATRIRDSYIMKQKLSRAELEQLERSLPADFVAMDQRFHRHAEGLAQAAHRQDHELAVFYFSKMLEGCGSCHASYAAHTFPGYRRTQPAPHTH